MSTVADTNTFQLQSDIKHVGAGFMPAFKFKQTIVLVIERGHKARAYVLALQLW